MKNVLGRNPIVLPVVLAALLGTALPAQVDPDHRPEPQASLRTLRTAHVDVREAFQILSQLYRRDIHFDDGRSVQNLVLGPDAILVFEHEKGHNMIADALAQIDIPPSEPESEDEVFIIRPKNLSGAAMLGFAQRLFANRLQTRASLVQSGETLLLRAPSSLGRELVASLEAIDEALPAAVQNEPAKRTAVAQVLLHLWVISPGGTGAEPPAVVAKALRRILEYDRFSTVALGVLRLGAEPDTGVTMSLPVHQPEGSFSIDGMLESYDKAQGVLSFSNLSVRQGGQTLFGTSTAVYEDEYAVLGVSGTQPLFVVLRYEVIERPRKAN